jgi:branched-chain amino acid transport system permease protein
MRTCFDVPTTSAILNATLTGILSGGLFAAAALGLSLVFGVMRLINLAHGEILVLGAYLALVVNRVFGLDPLLSMVIVAPVLFLLSIPLFKMLIRPAMRQGQESAMLTTFALAVIAQSLYVLLFSGDTQTLPARYSSSSISFLNLDIPVMYLITFVMGTALCLGVDRLLRTTDFGRAVRASSEDPEAAAALGVSTSRTHMYVFAIAAACAAVAGILIGTTFTFTPTAGLTYLLSGFAVVVLGGLGSVRGTLLGAIALGLIESLGALAFGDGYRTLVGYVAFLVILTVRPQGLFGRKVAV